MAVSILVLENADDAPVARLGEWLTAAGAELEVRKLEAGDPVPASLDGYQGLVVLGGGMNAYDDRRAPYLPSVRGRLSEALAGELPVLAVCLGAQLLAVAAGGRVSLGTAPEYGAQLIAKRQAAATDALFKELPITPDVLQWHVDEVSDLPAGAVQLAASPGCEQQAFRIGRLAWGVQFHIETTPEIVTDWARHDAGELADFDLDAILARAIAVHDDLAEVWQPVAQRFVEIAADPSAVPGSRSLPLAGRPTSTAAPITDPAAIRAALAAEMQAASGSGQP
ncbi:MAG TPA: type 1 glutamine amidotransferase [Jatrophihabitans sp.]|nr:type 1 glutamine amidotransferase [Jatrophihabitans sp.]